MRGNTVCVQALKYPLKMKGLMKIFVWIALMVVGGGLYAQDSGPETGPCSDIWPKTIPSKDSLNLGDLGNTYYAFAFPSVVALRPDGTTRPAVFYKTQPSDVIEIYDPFGVLVRRLEYPKDEPREVSDPHVRECTYTWYGYNSAGKPVSPGVYLAILRRVAGGTLGGVARQQYILVKVPPKAR